MTTPTRSMARMAHSPPSPPPSAARLGQDSSVSIFPPTLAVSVVGVVNSVWGVVDSVWGVVDSVWGVVDSVWGVVDSVWGVVDSVWGMVNSVWGVVNSVWGVVNSVWGVVSSSVVCISWSEPMEDEDGLILCATVLAYMFHMLDTLGHQVAGL